MQRISLREFQLHASKYIKQLPIELTQYNVPIAIINPFEEVLTQQPKSSNTVLTQEYNRCEGQGCRSYETVLTQGEGYDDEGNLREYKKWLCSYHRKQVK